MSWGLIHAVLPSERIITCTTFLDHDHMRPDERALWLKLMREHGVPHFTVDGHRPLAAFDVLLGTRHLPRDRSCPSQIGLHGIISLLAYSTLSVASLVAILMTVQEHALRNHRPLPFLHALPLTLTESLLFQLIGVGFILLGLSLVTGVLFVEDLFAQHLVHKTVLTVAAWIVFGILLLARWRLGLRGRRAAWLILAGMLLLLVGYFGVKLILASLQR